MAEQKLVKFNQWYQGFRAGETAGFTPEQAAGIVAEGVAEYCDAPKEQTSKGAPEEKGAPQLSESKKKAEKQ